MTEIWMAIAGFDRYEVSNAGRVRRLAYTITKKSRGGGAHKRHFPAKLLAPGKHTNGYLTVRLYPDETSRMVSRLVCAAFNGPAPTADAHADHINGVRRDNRAENLRWLSPKENRSQRDFAAGARHGMAKLSLADVQIVRAELTTSTEKPMAFDRRMAARFGVTRETIRNVRRRNNWSDAA